MANYHIKRDKSGNALGPGICVAQEGNCKNGGIHGDENKINQVVEAELTEKYSSLGNDHKVRETVKKALPTGTLAPARLDDDGNIVKPELTYESYYEGTNKKHFMSKADYSDKTKFNEFLKTPGSQFDPSKVSSVKELIELTVKERPEGLNGDDREELIKRGANPKSFTENYRYIITPVGGYLGAMKSDQLPDDTKISFYEKIPDSNIVSVTVEMDKKPSIDYGVMILGKRSAISPDNLGENGDDDVFVTAHPGLPSNPNPSRSTMTRDEKDEFDRIEHENYKNLEKDGKMTIAEVRKLKGDREFNLNVKLAQ